MFEPSIEMGWSAGLAWLAGIAVVAFLVAWSMSDLRPTRRVVYVPVLALVTGALVAGYLLWSESGTAFWTNNWAAGIVGAVAAAAALGALLSRKTIPHGKPQAVTAGTVVWDGLVYGAGEGLLLSVLPVLVMWQTFSSNGWTVGWRSVAAATLSIAASVLVIVIHHMGYPDFRTSRMKMRQAILGCGVLSLAYLLTASVIAPVVAHAILHVLVVRKGMELPPHEGTTPLPGTGFASNGSGTVRKLARVA